jgi:hypothetical protein
LRRGAGVVDELAAALERDGDQSLAEQVATLEVWDYCGCGDEFCGSFYTAQKPSGPWPKLGVHSTVAPSVRKGMVILDVLDGVIRYVEILNRPEIRKLIGHT